MKKIALFLMMAAAVMGATAQNQHMTFKGIPIDGSVKSFAAKLQQKGFTSQGMQDGNAFLKGMFAGYKDCTVGVVGDESGTTVKVAVIFPEYDKWSLLYGCFSSLKDMLTQKYGTPSEESETFDTYSQPDDDNERMYEVTMDRCKYYAVFETQNGTIELQISHANYIEGFVLLSYYDKLNQQKAMNSAIDDL